MRWLRWARDKVERSLAPPVAWRALLSLPHMKGLVSWNHSWTLASTAAMVCQGRCQGSELYSLCRESLSGRRNEEDDKEVGGGGDCCGCGDGDDNDWLLLTSGGGSLQRSRPSDANSSIV